MMIRNKIIKYVACMVLCLFSIESFGQKLALTIGSYNIRYDNKGDRDAGNGWDHRLPVIGSIIRYTDFDILGCQEVLAHQLEGMKAELPGYDYVGVGRDDGVAAGEFAPIFFKRDKFKMLSSGHFWLSEFPDRPSKGWDAALPRICTYVHLQEKKSGKKLWYFNLHMDHVGILAREESSKLVLRRIQEMLKKNEAAVLTGDFNVDQENAIYGILNDSGLLKDSYELSPEKMAWNGTFNAFDTNLFTKSRIDHVFVTKAIQIQRYGVLTETYRQAREDAKQVKKGDFPKELSFKDYVERLPSDHFPVVVKALF